MANSMIGVYVYPMTNSTLTITKDDPYTGNASGTLTNLGTTIPVTLHYHHPNSNPDQGISLRIWGSSDDPNNFFGAAGFSRTSDYTTINLTGGWARVGEVTSFAGNYVRES